jgi:hypothetical protein
MITAKKAALPSATLMSTKRAVGSALGSPATAEHRRQDREQHEDHDRDEVLDDQPADGDPALRACRPRRDP